MDHFPSTIDDRRNVKYRGVITYHIEKSGDKLGIPQKE